MEGDAVISSASPQVHSNLRHLCRISICWAILAAQEERASRMTRQTNQRFYIQEGQVTPPSFGDIQVD